MPARPVEPIESIAASIFACHGVDFAVARRAGGWTNAVWLADDLVLRLSTRTKSETLLREARLSKSFPAGVGYPDIVDSGITSDHAWMLARRLPGNCLGEVWAGLGPAERVAALQELWARAEAVHSVPLETVQASVPARAWFNSTDRAEAEAGLARLAQEEILTGSERSVLQETLSRFWETLPAAPQVLCHGDMTLDNALWHEGHVIALLDFEFAVHAPVQLDLNHLVKCVYGPGKNGNGPLCQAVRQIALPFLGSPAGKTLLRGYAILLELWLLETWLAHPEGEGPLEQWEPLRRLRSLADGQSGYLAPLLTGMDSAYE